MNQKSRGSKLGTIAGLILVLGFFLPWVRACGEDVSGYALATSDGLMENPWLIWVTPLVGLFCAALYFFARSDTAQGRVRAGLARLIAALIGLLLLLDPWSVLRQAGGGVGDLLLGGWLVVLGYLGLVASSLMDFAAGDQRASSWIPDAQPARPSSRVDHALSGAPPSQVDHSLSGAPPAGQPAICTTCGQPVKPDARFCMSCGHALQPIAVRSQAASPLWTPSASVNKRIGSLQSDVEIVREPVGGADPAQWLVAKKGQEVDAAAPLIACQCPWCGQHYNVVGQPAHLEFFCPACGKGVWVDVS